MKAEILSYSRAQGLFAGIDISGIQKAVAPTARVLDAARKAGVKVLYLKMAYKVKGFECWVEVCSDKTISGNNSINLGQIVAFDIFPETLDQFVRMDWDGATRSEECITYNAGADEIVTDCRTVYSGFHFDPQRDRDGDGLIAQTFGGNDPDDTKFDTDGDGVPDAKELEIGTLPYNGDSDFDGVWDGDELARGSDPLAREWRRRRAS